MKNFKKMCMVSCLYLFLFTGLSSCDKKDEVVSVTYQQLANFPSWYLSGKGGADATGMWHVYMLRGIVNQDKNAQPFTFDIQKVTIKSGGNLNSSFSPMNAANNELPGVTIPIEFKASVPAKSVYTIDNGTGVLFFIKEDNDTEQTAQARLYYNAGGESQPIIMTPLNGSAAALYGQLDIDFLNKILVEQNKYKNNYDAAGNKQ